jgi:hypothetical protein
MVPVSFIFLEEGRRNAIFNRAALLFSQKPPVSSF